MKKILLSELRKGMVIVKFDKPDVCVHYIGQKLEDINLIENLANQGVKYAYVSEAEHIFKKLNDIKKVLGRKSYKKNKLEATTFSTANNLILAKQLCEKANKAISQAFQKITADNELDFKQIKKINDEFVNICLYKNEVFMNMLLVNEAECEVNHAINVSILSIALGRRLGLPSYELENLGMAGLLHDVGMLKLPPEVYKEYSKLTHEEFCALKSHPEKSFLFLKMLGKNNETVLQAVLQHHEKGDGSGYPEGLTEKNITQHAKILSIADTYDTLTSARPYVKRTSPVNAIRMIFGWSGKQFNETIVKFFVGLMGIYPVGSILTLESGEVGVVYEALKTNDTAPKILIIMDNTGEEIEPYPFDLSTKDLKTGQALKRIKETLTEDQITTDIFTVLEKYFLTEQR